eukprot:262130-Chlamydomonas_euryale.AAC.5
MVWFTAPQILQNDHGISASLLSQVLVVCTGSQVLVVCTGSSSGVRARPGESTGNNWPALCSLAASMCIAVLKHSSMPGLLHAAYVIGGCAERCYHDLPTKNGRIGFSTESLRLGLGSPSSGLCCMIVVIAYAVKTALSQSLNGFWVPTSMGCATDVQFVGTNLRLHHMHGVCCSTHLIKKKRCLHVDLPPVEGEHKWVIRLQLQLLLDAETVWHVDPLEPGLGRRSPVHGPLPYGEAHVSLAAKYIAQYGIHRIRWHPFRHTLESASLGAKLI